MNDAMRGEWRIWKYEVMSLSFNFLLFLAICYGMTCIKMDWIGLGIRTLHPVLICTLNSAVGL